MKRYLVLIFVVLTGLILVFALAPGKKVTDIKDLDLSVKKQEIKSMEAVKPDLDFGKIPLYFITNKGQVNKKAKFYAKASSYTLWLTKEGLVFAGAGKKENPKSEIRNPKQIQNANLQNSKQKQGKLSTHEFSNSPTRFSRPVSRMIFIGANKNPGIIPVEEAKFRGNYIRGKDKSKWHCDIPTTRVVLYKNLYKNIDLKVYGLEKQIEYDWVVKTGADPGDIRFRYKNVKGPASMKTATC